MSLALLRRQLAEILEGVKPGIPGLATGIAALDAALPGGGLPCGRLTELVGAPGTGKTTLVRWMVERAVGDGWSVAYVDAARTLAPRDWAHIAARGEDASGLWVVRPDDPARGAWCADVLLRSGAFRLVVLDGAPVLARGVAVRLTRLAHGADSAFVVLADGTKASELAGSLRLRVARHTRRRAAASGTSGISGMRGMPGVRRVTGVSEVPQTAQHITVVIEKGGPHQHVNVGAVDRGIAVARRLCSHPEVPDRRGVARQQKRDTAVSARLNARSRRCAEPRIPDEPFIAVAE